MPITTITTASTILNRVAAEIGLEPVTDPYSSQDPSFIQMRYLLNTAGEELIQAFPWGLLTKQANIATMAGDSGSYDLPDDYNYLLNQTAWERSQNVRVEGPLSAQQWQYLLGRDLVSTTIYASFRIFDGQFQIFPQPPPEGLDIFYEYISKNWVQDPTESPAVERDEITKGTDIVLYDKTLISRYLRVKFLEAKGFDTTKAQDDFNQTFSFVTSKDKGAQVLNVGRNSLGFPYLDGYYNVPDTGYGRT